MQVELCPTHLVDAVWLKLQDGFHRAVMKTGGDITPGELWTQARSGNAFLFVAHDGTEIHGASLWRFETWQTGAKFRCLALYGKGMKGWISDMHALVKQAAGRADLVSEGRVGWPAVFPKATILRHLYEEKADA